MLVDKIFLKVWEVLDEYHTKYRFRPKPERIKLQRYFVMSTIVVNDFRLFERVRGIINSEHIADEYTIDYINKRKSKKLPYAFEGDRSALFYMAYGLALGHLGASYNNKIKEAMEEIVELADIGEYIEDFIDALVLVSWSGFWDKDYDRYLSYALEYAVKSGSSVEIFRLTGKILDYKIFNNPKSWIPAYWVVTNDSRT